MNNTAAVIKRYVNDPTDVRGVSGNITDAMSHKIKVANQASITITNVNTRFVARTLFKVSENL